MAFQRTPEQEAQWRANISAAAKERQYRPKSCRNCHQEFKPKGNRSQDCDDCLDPRAHRQRLQRERDKEKAKGGGGAP